MLVEKVHNTCYLLSHEIDLSTLTQDSVDIFRLRGGYEIVSMSMNVVEIGDGIVDIGTTNTQDAFLNDISLSEKNNYQCIRHVEIPEDTFLTLNTTSRKGIIKIKLFYFTAGQIIK